MNTPFPSWIGPRVVEQPPTVSRTRTASNMRRKPAPKVLSRDFTPIADTLTQSIGSVLNPALPLDPRPSTATVSTPRKLHQAISMPNLTPNDASLPRARKSTLSSLSSLKRFFSFAKRSSTVLSSISAPQSPVIAHCSTPPSHSPAVQPITLPPREVPVVESRPMKSDERELRLRLDRFSGRYPTFPPSPPSAPRQLSESDQPDLESSEGSDGDEGIDDVLASPQTPWTCEDFRSRFILADEQSKAPLASQSCPVERPAPKSFFEDNDTELGDHSSTSQWRSAHDILGDDQSNYAYRLGVGDHSPITSLDASFHGSQSDVSACSLWASGEEEESVSGRRAFELVRPYAF
jgi:hypothetical protein